MAAANMIVQLQVAMMQKWTAARMVNVVKEATMVKIAVKKQMAKWTVVKMANAQSPAMMVRIAAKNHTIINNYFSQL